MGLRGGYMKVYQIMEYRSLEERYSWGIYSSKENAMSYLEKQGWDNDEDFEIIEHELDANLK